MKADLSELVKSALEKFEEGYLDAQDRGWQQAVKKDLYGMKKPQTIDRQAVFAQYDYMMSRYRCTKDFSDAVKTGAMRALDVYGQKFAMASYAENGRYSSKNHKDLKNFFQRDTCRTQAWGYIEESSTYEKYLSVIHNFCETVDNGCYGQVNFDFQPWGMKEANPTGTKSYIAAFQKKVISA